ncbi:MAG: peptide ABC transporter substrate-binding protein [Verrucomicrobiales bacterium]|nr:peptide ABC transporter substrate-binding protein [Verrucomicrobiales bacterium]
MIARASICLMPLILVGCGSGEKSETSNEALKILKITVGAEPEDIDPHVVTGVPEHHIIAALTEGLVAEDPVDLHPVPGVAEKWEVSEDGKVYTFQIRENAKWSNGDPVTSTDFAESYKRILTPALASKYAYMLFVMEGAEDYSTGKLKDFSKVGVKVINKQTLQIKLNAPTPYFLSLLNHYTWFPVHISTVKKYDGLTKRGSGWTKPENFVGNGAFNLKSWTLGRKLVVEKSPTYWDAKSTKLDEIHFFAIELETTQENAFRAGQLHNIYNLHIDKVATYKKEHADELRIKPHLASYFYRFNVNKKPCDDVRIRQALTMAIDRESIVKNVTKGEQMASTFFTPPGVGGYTARARFKEDVGEAQKLLAQAGYPNGEGFPSLELLYNTTEGHRIIAEAIQQMWKKNLNINVTLQNQEWKVYLDRQRQMDYQISRAGWTGDYPDPNTFLDMWTSWSQQNQTGWSDTKYDALIRKAAITKDPDTRLEVFQEAEEILMDQLPIIPIYIYTRVYALHPAVKNWHANVLDHHPWKHIDLDLNLLKK